MTNLEKIIELSKSKGFESLKHECGHIDTCNDCSFMKVINDNCNGIVELAEQLLEEYKEPKKLTKRERAFCEYVQSGYIERMQKAKNSIWHYGSDGELTTLAIDSTLFSFIKDNEPYTIEELLKWEVED